MAYGNQARRVQLPDVAVSPRLHPGLPDDLPPKLAELESCVAVVLATKSSNAAKQKLQMVLRKLVRQHEALFCQQFRQ